MRTLSWKNNFQLQRRMVRAKGDEPFDTYILDVICLAMKWFLSFVCWFTSKVSCLKRQSKQLINFRMHTFWFKCWMSIENVNKKKKLTMQYQFICSIFGRCLAHQFHWVSICSSSALTYITTTDFFIGSFDLCLSNDRNSNISTEKKPMIPCEFIATDQKIVDAFFFSSHHSANENIWYSCLCFVYLAASAKLFRQ